MILVQMFPYKTARIKADVQQAAVKEVGPHTPALWQSVVVRTVFNTLPVESLRAGEDAGIPEMESKQCMSVPA